MKSKKYSNKQSSPTFSLQERVEKFISRQKEKEKQQAIDSPNFALNKSVEFGNLDQNILLCNDSTIDLSATTIKASQASLQEFKSFQDFLRSKLRDKKSYAATMVLKKVAQKSEEIQEQVKKLESKEKKLNSLEKSITTKLRFMRSKERDTIHKSKSSNPIQKPKENPYNDELEFVKKKIVFEKANKIGSKSARNPENEFSPIGKTNQNQLELSQLETELRLKSQELSKIAEELKTKEAFLFKQQKDIENKQNELNKKEKSLQLIEEKLKKQTSKHQEKTNTLEKNLTYEWCKSLVWNFTDKALKNKKNKLLWEENIGIEDRMRKDIKERHGEVVKREKKVAQDEAKISRHIKLLAEEKSDLVLADKCEEVAKKEAKLRRKHLELLEFKEMLKDKEEEILEKDLEFKFRRTSVFSNPFFKPEPQFFYDKNETVKMRDSERMSFLSNQHAGESKEEYLCRKELELIEMWKILQEKEGLILERDRIMMESGNFAASDTA